MGDQAHRPARLILVKHGQPLIEEATPRSSWSLSEAGRAAATRLAARLAAHRPDALYASSEPKAADTAAAMGAVLGLPVQIDADFGEHRADDKRFGSQDAFLADVTRLFREPNALVMGEETGTAACARFDAAVTRTARWRTPVVVAHGRVIALWLSARQGFDPLPFWQALGVGQAVLVRDDGYEVVAP